MMGSCFLDLKNVYLQCLGESSGYPGRIPCGQAVYVTTQYRKEGVSKFKFLMHPFNFLRIEWGLAETTFRIFQSNIRFS